MTLWDRLIRWLAKDAPQPVRRRRLTRVAKKKGAKL